jgi:hypothetical protein
MLENIVELLNGKRKVREWLNLEMTPAAQMIDGGGADSGGINKFAHGTHIWTPGATLSFQPQKRKAGPWDNLYLYNTLTRDHLDTQFYYQAYSLMYPTQALIDAEVATELECEDCRAGLAYDMGWQVKPSKVDGAPAFRWFDETAQNWNTVPGLPAPALTPGVPLNIEAYFVIDAGKQTVTHDSITIAGKNYPVGATHHAKQKWSAQTWYLHNAIQLDSDGKGTPEGVQIKNWNVLGL